MDIEGYEKIPPTQTVFGPDLLKILPPHTKLFDNISSSGSHTSELSGPFSDVVYNAETQSKLKAKELLGKDLYTAFSFSKELITAIEEVKKGTVTDTDYPKPETDVIENIDELKSISEDIYIEKYKFLQEPYVQTVEEEIEEEKIEEKKKDKEVKEKKKKLPKIWENDDVTVFDTMSGYWRMLSVFDEFKISPPWFDAYEEGKRHWLQTNPIPTEVFEDSKKKCAKWLDQYFKK